MTPFEITGKLIGKIHTALTRGDILDDSADEMLDLLNQLPEAICDYTVRKVEASSKATEEYKKMTA